MLYVRYSFPSPIAHWDFNSSGETEIYDKSPNKFDADLAGTYQWQDGVDGDASLYVGYNTTEGKATIKDNDNEWKFIMGYGNMSVSLWAYATSSLSTGYHIYFSFGGYDDSHTGWQVGSTSNTLAISMTDSTNQSLKIMSSSTLLPKDSTWHHVVFVFDRDNSVCNVYLDGDFGSSIDISYFDGLDIAEDTTINPKIGRTSATSDTLGAMVRMDQMKVFNHAISKEHVRRLYSEFS